MYPDSPLAEATSYPITPLVGPEFVTGSTRMKSGTAQKNGFKYDFNLFND